MIARIRSPSPIQLVLGITVAALAAPAPQVEAQVPGQPPPVLAPYRAPSIALVQPAPGGTVPQDRPVVVFRFAQGEPTDPIDAASFAVAVDGRDCTSLFQVSAGEAWGPLALIDAVNSASALTPGDHQVAARICSSRGSCAAVATAITVVLTSAKPSVAPKPIDRKSTLVDLLLAAARKLLVP